MSKIQRAHQTEQEESFNKAKRERERESNTIAEEMEEEESGGVIYPHYHWLWAVASVGQLGWGISEVRKGHAGDCRLMPLKAFAVASLFVGASASASAAILQANGIHKVKDLMEVGANLRTQLGIPPRPHHGKTDDLSQ